MIEVDVVALQVINDARKSPPSLRQWMFFAHGVNIAHAWLRRNLVAQLFVSCVGGIQTDVQVKVLGVKKVFYQGSTVVTQSCFVAYNSFGIKAYVQ